MGTEIDVIIYFNSLARENFKEERIIKAIRGICKNEKIELNMWCEEQKEYKPTLKEEKELLSHN